MVHRRNNAGEEFLAVHAPRNRLTAYTKGGVTTAFRYDNAGNLLADDKALYSYDCFNRTTKVETFDGSVQVNRYDAEGLRYEMEENGRLVRFIFNPNREVVSEEGNGRINRLIRTSELIAAITDSDSARTYYHYASDEMGSTTHLVDEAGRVQNRYEYDAWGNIIAQTEAIPNRFTYYGQQLDPITQQYYLRARFYNPVIGRFTQEDTYRGDGLNLYAYCANNPVYYVDPSGYDCEKKDSYYQNTDVDYDPADAYAYQKYKDSLIKPDATSPGAATEIIQGSELKDPAAIGALTQDGSDISDWVKMESIRKYSTEFGEGVVHFYYNKVTGQVSTYDFKIKISIPKKLRNSKYDFWILEFDENFMPSGLRY